ncbi:uncharacterized protein LOC143276550 isoform X2 [Babylonia areolata]
MPGIKLMYTIGYTLSLAALILAVSIMIYFKRLHCSRNMIHLNMFLAFLVRAAFSLIRTVVLVKDLGFPRDVNNTGDRIVFIQDSTHWECKLFFTLFYYILLASVMWLFNEGLYLVLILSVSVFAEKTKVRWFVLLGWGSPVIFVIPWVICRIKFDDMLCWNVHVKAKLFWILRGPMVASVAVNFAFFIVIIRMLFSKLTASNCPESKKVRYRKLAKSTLILIPLFAVYYMGFIWLPDGLSPASDLFKLYVEMLFNSFQGFLVALLFCFLNAEVQNEIRKKWRMVRRGRGGSWRSQPSNGSCLRRGATTTNHKDAMRRNSSHSRSFLDNTVITTRDHHHHHHHHQADTPATTMAAGAGTVDMNGPDHHHHHHHNDVSGVDEESAQLTSMGGGGSSGVEVGIPLCVRQDFNDNHAPPWADDEDDDDDCVADTGFCEDVVEEEEEEEGGSCDAITGSRFRQGGGDRSQLLPRHSSAGSGNDVIFPNVSAKAGEDGVGNDVIRAQHHAGYDVCHDVNQPPTDGEKRNFSEVTRTCDVKGFVPNDVSRKCDVEVFQTGSSNCCHAERHNGGTSHTCVEDEGCDRETTWIVGENVILTFGCDESHRPDF